MTRMRSRSVPPRRHTEPYNETSRQNERLLHENRVLKAALVSAHERIETAERRAATAVDRTDRETMDMAESVRIMRVELNEAKKQLNVIATQKTIMENQLEELSTQLFKEANDMVAESNRRHASREHELQTRVDSLSRRLDDECRLRDDLKDMLSCRMVDDPMQENVL